MTGYGNISNDVWETELKETMEKVDRTIREAEKLVQQTEDFYQNLGLTRGVAKKYLQSDRVPPDLRKKIMEELNEWEKEVNEEIKRELELSRLQSSPARLRSQKIMNLKLTKV